MREVPTLLILHGGRGADHSTFKPAFSALASIAQVIYRDLRGNGRSDAGLASKLSLEQWTQDIHSFCEALSIDRPIVFGHSMGGIVAMLYAIRHPNSLVKLVLSSTSTQPVGERSFAVFNRLGGPSARAAAMAFWTDPSEVSLARYERLCIPLYTRTPRSNDSFERAVRNPAMRLVFIERELRALDLLHQIDRIKCPTLILAGDDDPITPIEDSQEIAAAMGSNDVELASFPSAGHGVYHDCPQGFLRRLTDFIMK